MSIRGYQFFHLQGWRGYVLGEEAGQIPLQELLSWSQGMEAVPVRTLPLRSIARLPRPGKPDWFLKTIQGLTERKDGLLNAWKWRMRPSRAIHILKISQCLEEAGFQAPKVILAARHRPWWPWGRPPDLLVTQAAQGPLVSQLLCGTLDTPPLPEPHHSQLLQKTGRELAKLHRAGFVHGDSHPGNYFLDPHTNAFTYIDNDRTCRFQDFPLQGAARNLASAAFYLSRKRPLQFPQELPLLLEAYLEEARLPTAKAQALRSSLETALAKRLRRGR